MVAWYGSGLAATLVAFQFLLGGVPVDNGPGPASKNPGASAITEESLKKHVYFLASDELQGRLPGTPGAEKAAQYIADNFKRAGLKPAGTKGYFQEFPFVSKIRLGQNNQLSFNTGKLTARLHEDFVPLSFSSTGKLEGDVVFAGFGISAAEAMQYDDYAGLDVKDKIVLVLPFGPAGSNPHSKFAEYHPLRYKAVTAQAKGAKGLLVVADDEVFKDSQLARLHYDANFGDAGMPALIVSRQFATQLLKSGSDVGSVHRTGIAELEKHIATGMKPDSFTLKNVRAAIETEIIKEKEQGKNVAGWLEGSDPKLKNEVVVIGAHYDHLGLGGPSSLAPKEGDIHNGADDNASGTAGVLELAKAFAAGARPKRSLLFLSFSAEEKGLLGSAYYTDHPVKPLGETVAMINMDMIGRMREDKLVVQGVGTSPEWKNLLEKINGEAKLTLSLSEDGYGPSDHSSFYKKQIPVLFFFTGNHEDYHRPSDDADKINYPGERKVVSFIYQAVLNTANQDVRPAYQKAKGEDPAKSMGSGFRVYLGTIPDYAAEVEGVKFSGVREGSPAEKAGMLAGDVLVKIAGRDIKNVYDYTYALQELKPGEETEIVVVRGKERLTLKLIPGKR
ncbi:MAG: M28 family peptidase [Blastocatellia bacterium]|nr:M28 family peptidase [Blastocatellia bacterium]